MPGTKSLARSENSIKDLKDGDLLLTACLPGLIWGPLSVTLDPIPPTLGSDISQLSAYILSQDSGKKALLHEDFPPDPSNSIRFLYFFSS